MLSVPDVIDRRYRAIGGAAEFFACEDREVLCESGAGTGKTHSFLRKADWVAWQYPRCRQFFARDTRASMTESVLVEFEESVLWPGHPAIVGTASRAQRDHYVYPNGSEIIISGLDNPDRIMSTQYDRGYVFEATETELDQWEKLLTRIRNGRTDYHQLAADVNPASEFHYLNQRFPKAGEPNPMPIFATDPDTGETVQVSSRRRVLYRHEDNPRLYENGRMTRFGREYILGTLGSLTGARRERLLNHRWVSEEGQVWPEFDPATHCVYAKDLPPFKWFLASIDFGYNAPGCLQVWGFDAEKRAYRVAECYQRGLTIDDWARIAIEFQKRWAFRRGVADAARPDDIALLNKRLRLEHGAEQVFQPCDKSRGVLFGIDMVRDLLKRRAMVLVKDAAHYLAKKDEQDAGVLVAGVSPSLRQENKPTCTEQEIPGYVFRKNEDGKEIKDEPDPACADHGCDAARYLAVFTLTVDLSPYEEKRRFPKGSFGDLLNFDEEFDRWEDEQ